MNRNATTPNLITTTEVTEVIKNIVLEGVNMLRAEKFTTTFEVVRKLNPNTNQPNNIVSKRKLDEKIEALSFHLIEVTPETLADYRRKGISSFVLKNEERLFYSTIPNNMFFVSSTLLGLHKCAAVGEECHRLSAASDEEGGCAKVREFSKCIERYPWITTGYETFNTKHDSFVVINCLHYEKCPPRKHLTTAEINQLRLSLANYVWDDVKTIAEVKTRKTMNKSRHDNER